MKTKLSQDVKSRDRSPVFHSLEDPKGGGRRGKFKRQEQSLATAAVSVVSGCPKSDEVSGEERKRERKRKAVEWSFLLIELGRVLYMYIQTCIYYKALHTDKYPTEQRLRKENIKRGKYSNNSKKKKEKNGG